MNAVLPMPLPLRLLVAAALAWLFTARLLPLLAGWLVAELSPDRTLLLVGLLSWLLYVMIFLSLFLLPWWRRLQGWLAVMLLCMAAFISGGLL